MDIDAIFVPISIINKDFNASRQQRDISIRVEVK